MELLRVAANFPGITLIRNYRRVHELMLSVEISRLTEGKNAY